MTAKTPISQLFAAARDCQATRSVLVCHPNHCAHWHRPACAHYGRTNVSPPVLIHEADRFCTPLAPVTKT